MALGLCVPLLKTTDSLLNYKSRVSSIKDGQKLITIFSVLNSSSGYANLGYYIVEKILKSF